MMANDRAKENEYNKVLASVDRLEVFKILLYCIYFSNKKKVRWGWFNL